MMCNHPRFQVLNLYSLRIALILSATLGTSTNVFAQDFFFSVISVADERLFDGANETLRDEYQNYFRYREFETREMNRAPPGWTNSILAQAKKGVANVYAFTGGSYLKLIIADRMVDYAVAKTHGLFTSSTRYPVDHERVISAIERIRNFESQSTRENFVSVILESYLPAKSAYFRSNSSHVLIRSLISPREFVDAKIRGILAYLENSPTIPQFSHLHQNNGKRLFNTIILVAESAQAAY